LPSPIIDPTSRYLSSSDVVVHVVVHGPVRLLRCGRIVVVVVVVVVVGREGGE
jgi:hypothetical protein